MQATNKRAAPVKRSATKARNRLTIAKPVETLTVSEAIRNYAECRALGHSWAHMPAHNAADSYGAYGFRSQCSHCTTIRTKWITRSGSYRSPTYEYPKDYATRGDERLSGEQWRRVLITNLIGES